MGAIVAVPFWANTELLGYLKHVADEGGLDPGDVHRGEEAELFIDPSRMHLFDASSGENLTLRAAGPDAGRGFPADVNGTWRRIACAQTVDVRAAPRQG